MNHLPPFRHTLLPLLLVAMAWACGSGGDEAAPPGKGGGPGGFGGGFPGGDPATGGSAVPVEVVEILPGDIAAYIETNGTLEAEREVDIVARIGGPLVEILTEEGEMVEAGEALARIDGTEQRAQVEISAVQVRQAEVAYERARASLLNQVISQEVHDSAESALEAATAQLSGNRILLDYTQVRAPFGGLIIERAVKHGETVTNGQRLFRISDFDPLLCQIAVPERDLSRLSVGQPALLEVEAFPGEEFRGEVLRVSPVVDAATGTVRVTLEVDRQGRLSPGMFATVRLVTDVRENALIMPKRALSLESLADSVFVVEEGAAYRRDVTLGYEDGDRVEVLSGLQRGDRVIVVGQDGLTEASAVQILVGPGAEEAAPTRTAADVGGMSEERREAIRARMRERGMTDDQIEERLSAPRRPAATPEEASPASVQPVRSEPPARAGATPAAGGRRAENLSPQQREGIRQRLRTMGFSEEQIEERLRRGWGGAPDGGGRTPLLTPEERAALPAMGEEEVEALRERLRARGVPDQRIDAMLARLREPR